MDCYLGLLYAMEDVAVYGYITPLKVKIILALALSDSVVRDAEINMVRQSHSCTDGALNLGVCARYSKHSTWRTTRRFLIHF
jgi:hypothetical protein